MAMKQTLRKQIAARLKTLSSNQLDAQSFSTAQALRTLAEYQQAKSIAFYMSMENAELRTEAMIANAFEDGKRVFLPHIRAYEAGEEHPWFPTQRVHLKMLEMPNLQSIRDLEPRGKYKLKEPTTGHDCLSPSGSGLDLIILPGVGFSKDGRRLGHGAGFYDSFVNEHHATKAFIPKLIGVGLQEQLVEPADSLPMDAHDRVLDKVIINGAVYK